MGKKGSITIFMTLILTLMLSLLCSGLKSVQMAAARTQILNGADIGLYSLFGQYDRFLLEEYDLFFLEANGSDGSFNLSGVYDNLESYVKPVLKQNSQNLKLTQGGFTGYRLATDENGEIFYRQVVDYMKDTLGFQGISEVIDRMTNQKNKTEEAERKGQETENGQTLENYESEMQSASQNSKAAQEAAQSADSGEFSDGSSSQLPAETKTEVVNPIPILKRIRRMNLLDLVVPTEKGISDKEVNWSDLLSHRDIATGMSMPDSRQVDTSKTSQFLFQEYLSNHLGNYSEQKAGGLSYQMEYLLYGKNSDRENLKAVARKLLLIREGVNIAFLLADGAKMAEVSALALAIASGFLIPPAAGVIEAALLLCWSFAESILDLRELFAGGKVPLVKTGSNWQLSLSNLPYLLEKLDTDRRDCEGGMSYEDYLQVLFLTKSKSEILKRGMDMIEQNIRMESGRSEFRLDHCIAAVEVSLDVRANNLKTYTVTKSYSY